MVAFTKHVGNHNKLPARKQLLNMKQNIYRTGISEGCSIKEMQKKMNGEIQKQNHKTNKW